MVKGAYTLPGWPWHRENREFGLSHFPDRENTGNLGTTQKIWTTQGIFQISLKMKYFIVNCPITD